MEEFGNLTLQIPSLYGYFAENNKFYLVQEYVEGETIPQLVQSQWVMSDAAARELVAGFLTVSALKHCVVGSLREAGSLALGSTIDHPIAKVLIAGIKGFID